MPLSPDAEDALVDKIIARLFEKLSDADDGSLADADGDGIPDAAADTGGPAATPEDLDGDGTPNAADPHPLGDGDLERYADPAAAASAPGGGNTFVPGGAGGPGGPGLSDDELERYCNGRMDANAYEPEPERVRMSRLAQTQCGQELQRYQRQTETLARQLQAAQGKIAELERYARSATRERDLTGLLALGYDFDLAEELSDVADLEEKPYRRHLEKIRTRYGRTAVGQPAVPVAPDSEAKPAQDPRTAKISNEEMSAVIRYSLDHGLDFQEGLVRYRREQRGE